MGNFSEVRYYIYEILMFLVSVHAEVSATTRNLLERTLAALIVDTVEQALECFQQIKSFGRGGMLRVKHHLYSALLE
jgi:exocyst complex component 2